MYQKLSKRELDGKLLACTNFKDGTFVNLIEIKNPYKSGIKYTVHENTKNIFCSNGTFKTLDEAIRKFNLMGRNNNAEIGVRDQWFGIQSKLFTKY